ncbi:nuclear pore complex subunit [Emydomyces testavorans]|uniref:Nuclear pore complex subunit n=1 Tax=Emydomyces testavorans TaxID=2070801 RepID=A0AAF0IJL1_9EURO|nr:nuclear pore complex subunit [Emydomyces testavorans]
MFPTLGQTSSAGSVLSSTTNNQAGKRGLFDSPTTSQPSRPSPFATAGTGSGFGTGFGAQPAANTASIYSNTNPTATGPPLAPSTQPALGSSLLGQPFAQGTQSQLNQQTPAAGQSVLSTQPTQPAYFSSLLERGKKRPHPSSLKATPVDLPNLQLGLDDIRRTARGLGNREAAAHVGADGKAHYALTASGISPGQVLHDLRSLDAQAPAPSPAKDDEPFDPDNQKFLRRIQQRGREAMIAESFARVRRDFDAFLEERVNLNWDEQRQKIYEHFGLAPKGEAGSNAPGATMREGGAFGATKGAKFGTDLGQRPTSSTRRSVFGRSGLSKSVIGSTVRSGDATQTFSPTASSMQSVDARFLREKMGQFGTKVQHLNEARLQEKALPVLHEFAEVEKLTISDVPRQLFEAYQALISITNESQNMVSFAEPGAIKERQFAQDYLDENVNSNESVRLRGRVIEGSRRYLEHAFYREVENAIVKNPREAELGGVPSITNKIRAYIRLKAARKDLAPDGIELQMVGQDYCWVLIFYLLRCGFVSEAAEYVSTDQGFRSMDYKFVTYMTTYAQQRRLPRDLQQKINGEYQQRLRNAPEKTIDPYRMACYKIIGRCDLTQRRLEGISQGVEDWMWLQFTLAREDSRTEEAAGDLFGLQEIQNDVTEIGQRIFVKGQEGPGGYGIYFLLQILSGMFEHAVSYLWKYAPINAVHFGIALDYYGLLRVSDFYTSGEELSDAVLVSFTTKQLPQINFASLITQYTQEFRTGNVEAAVDYFTLICLNADLPEELGKSQASVCHEALREFILETRGYAKLLGDIKSDGTRIRGAIEQRLKLIKIDDQEEFLKTITVQAAAVADDKGLTADAVLLYHLAEDYNNVIAILNRALSDAVAVNLGAAALKIPQTKPSAEQQAEGQRGVSAETGTSFSLTSVEDPVALAKNMIGLYNTNAMYYQKIHPINRESCGILLRMMDAKSKVEAGRWAQALDDINNLQILPLSARGSVTYVRSAAQSFSALPPVIVRNGGHLIMWSITCISRERARLQHGVYENDMRQSLADELLVMAKDLMVFAGMIKYKLPPGVYEALAKAAGDMSVL